MCRASASWHNHHDISKKSGMGKSLRREENAKKNNAPAYKATSALNKKTEGLSLKSAKLAVVVGNNLVNHRSKGRVVTAAVAHHPGKQIRIIAFQ